MSPEERTLFDAWVRERDPEAFTQVARRYAAMVYATCVRVLRNSADAEDVAQECFETLATLRKPPSSSLGAWLHAVATNKSLNRLKSEGRRAERETRFAESLPKIGTPTWDDLYFHVDEAIAELPENLRGPIVAHFLAGQTHDEIARAEDVSRAAITQRIHRGVEKIRESLKRRGVEVGAAALATMLAENAAAEAAPALLAGIGKVALAGAAAPAAGLSVFTLAIGAVAAAGVVVMAGAVGLFAAREARPPEIGNAQSPVVQTAVMEMAAVGPVDLSNELGPDAAATAATPSPVAFNAAVTVETVPPAHATVYGRVTNIAGEPIAGVPVGVWVAGGGNPFGATNADGQYEVDGLDPVKQCWVFAYNEAPARRSPEVPLEDLLAGERREANLILQAGRVEGFVVDASGRDLSQARILAALVDGSHFSVPTSTLGKGGAFTLEGLAKGTYMFEVSLFPEARWIKTGQTFHIKVDEVLTGMIVRLSEAPAYTISGRVLDQSGAPIAKAWVQTQSGAPLYETRSTKTLDDGSYVADGLDEGSYFVRAAHALHGTVSLSGIPSGSEGVDFQLPLRGGLEVHVVRAQSEEPITRFEVLATFPVEGLDDPMTGGAGWRWIEAFDGRHAWEGLWPQTMPLSFRAEGYAQTDIEVEIPPGDILRDVRIELHPERIIRGRTVDEAGKPVAGVMLFEDRMPYSYDIDKGIRTRSDGMGEFVMRGCKPDIQRIVASHFAYAPAIEPVAKDTDEVTITMTGGARVAVRVSLDDVANPSCTVGIHYPNGEIGPETPWKPDDDGLVMLEHVTPGKDVQVLVRVTYDGEQYGHRYQIAPLDLVNGETAQAEFHFAMEDTHLEARVTEGDVPQPGLFCWLEYARPQGIIERVDTHTNDQGMVILEGMPSGAATLVVMPPGVTNPDEAVRLDLNIALGTLTTAECAY